MDAAAKLPSGLLQGKKTWVGSYDECVNALSPANNLTGHQIGGKYCMGATAIGIPGQYLMQGVCVPNTCTALDLNIWVAEIYSFLKEPDQTGMACEESMPYTAGAKAALAVCGVIVMLVTIGTIVDLVVTFNERRQKSSNSYVILVEDNETMGRTSVLSNETSSSGQIQSQRLNPPQPNRGKICQVAVAFSIVTNTRKLLSTSTSSGHLTSLNGMRVLSMFWIILGHTYLFASLGMTVENSLAAVKIIQRFSFQAIINATVSVDTFFFMSGLLVTYLYLKNRQESTDSFNWVLFYFHRYWRLTPVYAFCIMIWGSLFFHTLRGPMAVWRSTPQTQALINECSKSWWANILYINNYYPYSGDINQQCMGWSWYLANDMQFYIISPIILILLYRYRKIGFAVCGGLIGACIFIRAMTAFEFGIHVPNQAVTKHKDNYYGQHAPLYNKMYTRIAPYIVGMLLGYALHKTNCRVRMSK
ncbi:nose resistant to fluoxetine protein 6-like, partial [Ylistrum balloti]|uniref:nose resistant to fluoxetine protein 6-like n=1 Tax=Ylistrum balloti TaxID=509963 RepID=UPI002905C5BA